MEKISYYGAYGIIIRNGKIALITKSRGVYKGKLDMPGGGIEHSETPRIALRREVMEEAGLVVLNDKLFDTTSVNVIWHNEKDNNDYDFHHVGTMFLIKTKGRLKKVPDGIDSNGASWYVIDNLKRSELTPFTLYSLEKLGYKLIDR